MNKITIWIVAGIVVIAGMGVFIFKNDSVKFTDEKTGKETVYSRDDSLIGKTELKIVFKEESKTVGKLNMQSAGTTTVYIKNGDVMREYDWILNKSPSKTKFYWVNNKSIVCNYDKLVWECNDVTKAGGAGLGLIAAKQALQDKNYVDLVWKKPEEKRTIIGKETACAFIPQEVGSGSSISGTYYMCITKDALQLYAKTETKTPVGTVNSQWEAISYEPKVNDKIFDLPATPKVYGRQ